MAWNAWYYKVQSLNQPLSFFDFKRALLVTKSSPEMATKFPLKDLSMDQMSVAELEKSIAVPVSPPDYVYLGQIDLDN